MLPQLQHTLNLITLLLILSGQSSSYQCTMRNTFTRGNCRVEYVGNHNLLLWSEPKNASSSAKVHQFLIKTPGAWRVWQICYKEGLFYCFTLSMVTIMVCAHRCYLSMWQSCHAQGNDKKHPVESIYYHHLLIMHPAIIQFCTDKTKTCHKYTKCGQSIDLTITNTKPRPSFYFVMLLAVHISL